MSISRRYRRLSAALVGGVAAVVFSLGAPAFANHGERHASEQGETASANSQAASNSQSAEHAQNDEAAARREAAAQSGQGGQGGGAGTADAASNGETQGASPSNPDGGGLDKPECETTAEGCQGTADFDGNNGCGNDADREDDNNGNCGGPKKPKDCPPNANTTNGRGTENANARSRIRDCAPGTPGNPVIPENAPTNVNTESGNVNTGSRNISTGSDTTNVLGSAVTAAEAATLASQAGDGASVLGISFERGAEAAPAGSKAEVMGVQFERGQLARTGLGVVLLVLVGLGLVGSGAGLRRFARR
ncbi:MAG: hypothetical protein KY454_02780 [Actinobacteria bacterium]|nr:hypothetical protein [Actinomycetota bacterium]